MTDATTMVSETVLCLLHRETTAHAWLLVLSHVAASVSKEVTDSSYGSKKMILMLNGGGHHAGKKMES